MLKLPILINLMEILNPNLSVSRNWKCFSFDKLLAKQTKKFLFNVKINAPVQHLRQRWSAGKGS